MTCPESLPSPLRIRVNTAVSIIMRGGMHRTNTQTRRQNTVANVVPRQRGRKRRLRHRFSRYEVAFLVLTGIALVSSAVAGVFLSSASH